MYVECRVNKLTFSIVILNAKYYLLTSSILTLNDTSSRAMRQLIFVLFIFIQIVHKIKCDVLVTPECSCNSDGNLPPKINISLSIAYNSPTTLTQNKIVTDDCGYPRPNNKNTQDSYEGQFPWYVSIYKVSFQKISYHCAGTLISKDSVLTSAACITVGNPTDPGKLLAFVGAYNFLKFNGNGYQYRSVKEIILNPNFDFSNLDSDLAILKLKSRIRVTDFVRPICLWTGREPIEQNINVQLGIVSGILRVYVF